MKLSIVWVQIFILNNHKIKFHAQVIQELNWQDLFYEQ